MNRMNAATWFNILTLVAIIAGPILALWVEDIRERRRESKLRQVNLFRELMATRAPSARATARHIDALNAVEVEFCSQKSSDRRVVDAWTRYLDHLNDLTVSAQDKAAVWRWQEETDELLVALLYEMSTALGFRFDKESLQKHLSGRVTFDVFS